MGMWGIYLGMRGWRGKIEVGKEIEMVNEGRW